MASDAIDKYVKDVAQSVPRASAAQPESML